MSLNREGETGESLAEFAGFAHTSETQLMLLEQTITPKTLAQAILHIASRPENSMGREKIVFFAEDLFKDEPKVDDDEFDNLVDTADRILISAFTRNGILSLEHETIQRPGGLGSTPYYTLDRENRREYGLRIAHLQLVARDGQPTPPPLPQQ